MINLTEAEQQIVDVLSKRQSDVAVLRGGDGVLYWWGGLGGWSEPEMWVMEEYFAEAVEALLTRGVLETTDKWRSALLMVTEEIDGEKVGRCAGRWAEGRLIRLSSQILPRLLSMPSGKT